VWTCNEKAKRDGLRHDLTKRPVTSSERPSYTPSVIVNEITRSRIACDGARGMPAVPAVDDECCENRRWHHRQRPVPDEAYPARRSLLAERCPVTVCPQTETSQIHPEPPAVIRGNRFVRL
jgi:hypothetical protein